MLLNPFNPFPVLETPRLHLRQLHEKDATALQVCRSDEFVMRYISKPSNHSYEDTCLLISHMNTLIKNNEAITWGITLKGSRKVIGSIGFVQIMQDEGYAEIGYMLAATYHRQGMMQEALTAIINFGFDCLKLKYIQAIVDPENEASIALLKKNQFLNSVHFSDATFFEREFLGSLVFSLPSDEMAYA
jgi:ribosomal-protein-alanine N-acetyltransferase